MASILYYSTFCKYSNEIIQFCSRLHLKNNIHFICIDKRIKKNGETYILLENGTDIILPKAIKCVPCLILLNESGKIIEGDNIKKYINHNFKNNSYNLQTQNQTNNINYQKQNQNLEPDAFSLGNLGSVVSDSYSFLDQSSDELCAKGNGGIRQMYNYATINQNDSINTPPDDYVPNKVGNMSLDQIREMRDKDIPPMKSKI